MDCDCGNCIIYIIKSFTYFFYWQMLVNLLVFRKLIGKSLTYVDIHQQPLDMVNYAIVFCHNLTGKYNKIILSSNVGWLFIKLCGMEKNPQFFLFFSKAVFLNDCMLYYLSIINLVIKQSATSKMRQNNIWKYPTIASCMDKKDDCRANGGNYFEFEKCKYWSFGSRIGKKEAIRLILQWWCSTRDQTERPWWY